VKKRREKAEEQREDKKGVTPRRSQACGAQGAYKLASKDFPIGFNTRRKQKEAHERSTRE